MCIRDRNGPVAHWEKIIPKSSQPSRRASHTCTAYKDRYIFLIGGEGYHPDREKKLACNDTVLDFNIYEIMKETNDQEDQPIYPKNDVWIFDVETQMWTFLWVPNAQEFAPRFAHSTCVYKEQLVIFGGLKDFNSLLDDVSICLLYTSPSPRDS
eukprot:TRINITY_DN10552_c0_g1_i1.p1 TRINITY_DN10552_c0_g1~~TRINITY_DN10552_c0_g1_i1.p1  ORF type:complete len:154 (+),score=30.59 TRINITY_DN10552_c0_g1_i1:65-526(+)